MTHQLSFTDLTDLDPPTGRYHSSAPIPGTREYVAHQEHEQYQRIQTYLPKELLNDGWILHQEWEPGHENGDGEWIYGQWKWIVWHTHTGLKTTYFDSFHNAIDQAKRLAIFYELLPNELLEFHWIHNRDWFQKLPTLIHWHQHNHRTATRWATEYKQRASRVNSSLGGG